MITSLLFHHTISFNVSIPCTQGTDMSILILTLGCLSCTFALIVELTGLSTPPRNRFLAGPTPSLTNSGVQACCNFSVEVPEFKGSELWNSLSETLLMPPDHLQMALSRLRTLRCVWQCWWTRSTQKYTHCSKWVQLLDGGRWTTSHAGMH